MTTRLKFCRMHGGMMIEEAKEPETRARRNEKTVKTLAGEYRLKEATA